MFGTGVEANALFMRSNLSLEVTRLCTIPVTLVKDPIAKRLPKVSQNYATVSEMSERVPILGNSGAFIANKTQISVVCVGAFRVTRGTEVQWPVCPDNLLHWRAHQLGCCIRASKPHFAHTPHCIP